MTQPELEHGKDVLLFYEEFERDSFFTHDRYLKRLLRPIYHRFTRKRKVSGFLVWLRLLDKALRRQGYRVHLNRYALARRNPAYPVGIVGYPYILERWMLPNPVLLGPGMYDHPKLAPGLFGDPRYRRLILTCDWVYDMFRPWYGEHCVKWHAGIDTAEWPDSRGREKTLDVLVYDKILFGRELRSEELLRPVLDHLAARGLSHEVLRYRRHDHGTYRRSLERARSMVFLCEHETQGLAYQEAMACNVPIVAWDNGYWRDPVSVELQLPPVPASSVPFFAPECGERFREAAGFPAAFDRLWGNLAAYSPRAYVLRELSLDGSGEAYAKIYFAL